MADLRSRLLAVPEMPFEDVALAEYGGAIVRVMGMTAAGRSAYEKGFFTRSKGEDGALLVEQDPDKLDLMKQRLVVATAADPESGELLFTEADIEAVGALPASAVENLFLAAQRVNGMGKKALDEAKNG